MFRTVVLSVSLCACAMMAFAQEELPKPPKDSMQLEVTGCLNKQVLTATKIEPGDVTTDVRDFHLSGKKGVMDEVKSRNRQRVTVTGWVRKIDLVEPGVKIGGSRVRIGPVTSGDPMRSPELAQPQRRLVTMEAIKVEPYAGNCTK